MPNGTFGCEAFILFGYELTQEGRRNQKTEMNLGGSIGQVAYVGRTIQEIMPFLVASEILHIGAGASFWLRRNETVA